MNLFSLHPALGKLIVLQSRGKLRRVLRKCQSRRRAILTVVALGLATIWLAQAVVAIVLRPPADPAKFASIAPICMFAVCLLKTARLLMTRENAGVRFRPAELMLLQTAPLLHREIRTYKVAGHAVSVVITALCASFFLCPDVPMWIGAFLGALCTMLFTYLTYMVVAVVFEHLSHSAYRRVQLTAASILGLVVFFCLTHGPTRPDVAVHWTGVAQLDSFLDGVVVLSETTVGTVLLAPFLACTRIMTAPSVASVCAWGSGGAVINLVALFLLLFLEQKLSRRTELREQRDYRLLRDNFVVTPAEVVQPSTRRRCLPQLPWLGGAGPVAWRQLVTAWHNRTGVTLLLVFFTASLSGLLLSWFDGHVDDPVKILFVLVVMTNLILPAILTYDFRRDVDRFAALKSLPISSRGIVLGELLTPVLISTICQIAVVAIVASVHTHLAAPLAIGCYFLLPANVVIYGLENFVFLLYPYRITEYDLQASTRRVVMLFAKLLVLFGTLLFALATALLVVCVGQASQHFGEFGEFVTGHLKALLMVSWWLVTTAAALSLVRLLCWAFRRFDLSADQPV